MRPQGGKRSLARRRVAAVVVRQPRERLGHKRGDRRVAVNGKPLDPLKKLARQTERYVLVLSHEN